MFHKKIAAARRQGKAIPYQHQKTDGRGKLQISRDSQESLHFDSEKTNFGVQQVIASTSKIGVHMRTRDEGGWME